MSKFFILHFTLLILFTNSSLAAKRHIATVEKVRGNATKLLPGSLEASKIEVGDQMPEDTSIVTGKSSFVKLKFIDQSEVSLGPESKLVVSEMKEGEAGVISLLKGRIRTEVQKSVKNGEQNKLFIRTRTAALGIRGTDFQTIYNPENRMTSLLTFKGEVAMAKIDEFVHRKLEENQNQEVARNANNEIEVSKNNAPAIDEKKELTKLLKSSSAVVVPPGQNSFSSQALVKSSLPVKISPVQLNVLYKNDEFNEKDALNLNASNGIQENEKVLKAADQAAPPEGLYNSKTGDYAPKAGGFIDLNTGIYVAPDASATFNEKDKVYVTKNVGNVDADTGQYIAPKGLTLDPKFGFVVTKGQESKAEILALKEDLNRTIARDVVVGDLDGEVVMASRSLKEKYIRNSLSFKFIFGRESLYLNEEVNGRPFYKLESNLTRGLSIDFRPAAVQKLVPIVGFELDNVKFKDLSRYNFTQDSGTVFKMYLGMKYALDHRLELMSKFVLDQSHYADLLSVGPEIIRIRRVTLSKFQLKLDYEMIRSKEWKIDTYLEGEIGFRKRFNDLILNDINGLGFGLQPTYKITPSFNLSTNVSYKFENSFLYNAVQSVEQYRENVSLAVGLEHLF